MIKEPDSHRCPLCKSSFSSDVCHASCPMAQQCRMVRCPSCGLEFVAGGLVDRFFSFFRRGGEKKENSQTWSR